MMTESVVTRSLAECSINQITDLWNIGFAGYFRNMSKTPYQMQLRLGEYSIDPQLSVAAYIQGISAGFVMVGLKEINGEKLAWNGGTGVNPSFRGQGLSTLLLKEAIRRLQEEGVKSFALEVNERNATAIRLYERCGFEYIDSLLVMKQTGGISESIFEPETQTAYRYKTDAPELAVRVPFYRNRSSWTTQWFNSRGSRLLLVHDPGGMVCGYAIFQRKYDERGDLKSIRLTHCEADSGRDDVRDIIRFMLCTIMEPADERIVRIATYLPASNRETTQFLEEAGFKTVNEERLMQLNLSTSL